MISSAVAVLAIGAAPAPSDLVSPAIAQAQPAAQLPAPPANGTMGFVVHHFVYSVIQGKDACPNGPAPKNREIFLASLSPEERERLQQKGNEAEFMRRWRASVQKPDGSNICSQYAHFPERQQPPELQSQFAPGFNLDGDEGNGSNNPEGCAHTNFISPVGERGIDNQAYRALGCSLDWRGVDGIAGDYLAGFTGMLKSGEWTQVILLRGVDSLVNDDNVEVIYGNTPDTPVLDPAGKHIWNTSFSISDKVPRYRNVLRGRIANGVLTTDPKDIQLTQFLGQGLLSMRNKFDLHKGRLRLVFQPDGSVKGMVGGYQPIGVFVTIPSSGGMGSAITAGINCAGEYNALKKLADGLRDPKTGECTAISTALELAAVPAFVNDIPAKQQIASQRER